MWGRKCARMQPFATALEAGGVEYRPITFSCFGRPRRDAKTLMQSFGRRLARRKGTEANLSENPNAKFDTNFNSMIGAPMEDNPEYGTEYGNESVEGFEPVRF